MHMRDPGTAQVMRRAATGPHALMQRGAIAPYVPDRGSAGPQGLGFYMPARSARRFGSLGAGAVVGQTVTGVKAGVTAASVSTTVGAGIASAIGAGAAAGSVVPIIGTAIGAIIGLIASGVFSHHAAREDANFQQAMAMARQNGPQSVIDIGNKYLVLAGLFDLLPGQIKGNIPIYKKYGRMGEYKFVTDMCMLVYQAGQNGNITANDTPQSVFYRIVQPWINQFGFGTMTDSNAEMITNILLGMTAEYVAGMQTRWYAIGGQYPFGSLPPFALMTTQINAPAPISAGPTASPTPSPVASQPNSTVTELQRYLGGQYPQTGAVIGYMRDSETNQIMAIPAGGTYVGQDPVRGYWVAAYSTGQYYLVNGTLTPYPPKPVQMTQQVTATTNQPLNTDPSPASAGSGPAYSPPPQQSYSSVAYGTPQQQSLTPQIVDNTTGHINNTVLLAGGAALVLMLMMKHKHGAR